MKTFQPFTGDETDVMLIDDSLIAYERIHLLKLRTEMTPPADRVAIARELCVELPDRDLSAQQYFRELACVLFGGESADVRKRLAKEDLRMGVINEAERFFFERASGKSPAPGTS